MLHRFCKVSLKESCEGTGVGVILSKAINVNGTDSFIVSGCGKLQPWHNLLTLNHNGVLIDPITNDVCVDIVHDLNNNIKYAIDGVDCTKTDKRLLIRTCNNLTEYGLSYIDILNYIKSVERNGLVEESYYYYVKRHIYKNNLNDCILWTEELSGIGPDNEWSMAAINFDRAIRDGLNLEMASYVVNYEGIEQENTQSMFEAVKIIQSLDYADKIFDFCRTAIDPYTALISAASKVDFRVLAHKMGVELESTKISIELINSLNIAANIVKGVKDDR